MSDQSFHLIGVGGAGMSVVAELLLSRGFAVTGSDRADQPSLGRIRQAGGTVWVGHDPDAIDPRATVVISSAIRESDPELRAARERGQRVIHRSQALALAAQGRDFVAVAGTHGKTTTAGMLAAGLAAAGVDPSYAVGSIVLGFNSGAHLGAGRAFVAEADESDGSFLNYSPSIAIVTNIEPDHLDYYGTTEAFRQAFVDFAARLGSTGTLIACADDPGSRSLAEEVAGSVRVLTYGLADAPAGAEHVRIASIEANPDSSSVAVDWPGAGEVNVQVPVPGTHNVLNAVAAMIAGVELGVDVDTMPRALAAFRGTGRRFETRGAVGRIRVIDDYAHHPTEVDALIKQARVAAGTGRVLVLFQPHLYSRTRNFATEFAQALAGADVAVVTDIFGAREDPVDGVTSALITDAMSGAHLIGDLDEAARFLADRARPGDLVITVGAGSVTTAAETILARLRELHADG
ncbi:UDP-N-acetylmuramate--L-alanine ligase [Nanchangia anserum]|uniref:UDP-N-acetylmuramate--L-alanine ligase n=1 Tax=Nanchangia anserum TaxID=2692125 RepID=A0A8I0GCJ8_9ACTO|nr:UDP-N-acetylmuramate--L-alanine ligase [Nanchangia anserum]MBD3690238.1 UDP-N-acetylmuramate--L-alanine ligase [Nanchangia anserum]QOX82319.1 UDP-N-acetylmuramate--L-alanine ligase [Nanchangia anserum]